MLTIVDVIAFCGMFYLWIINQITVGELIIFTYIIQSRIENRINHDKNRSGY